MNQVQHGLNTRVDSLIFGYFQRNGYNKCIDALLSESPTLGQSIRKTPNGDQMIINDRVFDKTLEDIISEFVSEGRFDIGRQYLDFGQKLQELSLQFTNMVQQPLYAKQDLQQKLHGRSTYSKSTSTIGQYTINPSNRTSNYNGNSFTIQPSARARQQMHNQMISQVAEERYREEMQQGNQQFEQMIPQQQPQQHQMVLPTNTVMENNVHEMDNSVKQSQSNNTEGSSRRKHNPPKNYHAHVQDILIDPLVGMINEKPWDSASDINIDDPSIFQNLDAIDRDFLANLDYCPEQENMLQNGGMMTDSNMTADIQFENDMLRVENEVVIDSCEEEEHQMMMYDSDMMTSGPLHATPSMMTSLNFDHPDRYPRMPSPKPLLSPPFLTPRSNESSGKSSTSRENGSRDSSVTRFTNGDSYRSEKNSVKDVQKSVKKNREDGKREREKERTSSVSSDRRQTDSRKEMRKNEEERKERRVEKNVEKRREPDRIAPKKRPLEETNDRSKGEKRRDIANDDKEIGRKEKERSAEPRNRGNERAPSKDKDVSRKTSTVSSSSTSEREKKKQYATSISDQQSAILIKSSTSKSSNVQQMTHSAMFEVATLPLKPKTTFKIPKKMSGTPTIEQPSSSPSSSRNFTPMPVTSKYIVPSKDEKPREKEPKESGWPENRSEKAFLKQKICEGDERDDTLYFVNCRSNVISLATKLVNCDETYRKRHNLPSPEKSQKSESRSGREREKDREHRKNKAKQSETTERYGKVNTHPKSMNFAPRKPDVCMKEQEYSLVSHEYDDDDDEDNDDTIVESQKSKKNESGCESDNSIEASRQPKRAKIIDMSKAEKVLDVMYGNDKNDRNDDDECYSPY